MEKSKENNKEEESKDYYFVYGTLKRGFGNSQRVFGGSKTAKYIKDVETEPIYTMISLWAFPGVINNGGTSIKGELWEVSDKTTKTNLDRLEGYSGEGVANNLYNKEVIRLDDKDVNIYIYNIKDREVRKEQIVESGNWKY